MRLNDKFLVFKFLLLTLSLVCSAIGSTAFAHQGNLNQIPWVACEDKNLNDDCMFYNSKQDVFRGSCQSMSEVLMCVRNQPIEYAADNAQAEHSHHSEDERSNEKDTQNDGHSH